VTAGALLSLRPKPLRLCAGIVGAFIFADASPQDVAASRALWEQAGIANYEYSYQRVCECHPDQLADTIVTVSEGRVIAVRYARDDYAQEVAVAAEKLSWYRTIEDLFALVETARTSADVVRVSFDAEHGYPARVYIDYVTDLVGDEVDLKVTRFVPLP
jgi:hypothetical protein